MKDIMLQTIDNLKEKVKKNLYEIQNNQQSIRYWLKQPDSEQRSAELETKYALNKELLNENNDFINVQLTLTSFLERYKDTNVLQTNKGPAIVKFKNEDECFECTINGQLTYNENHPYYEN